MRSSVAGRKYNPCTGTLSLWAARLFGAPALARPVLHVPWAGSPRSLGVPSGGSTRPERRPRAPRESGLRVGDLARSLSGARGCHTHPLALPLPPGVPRGCLASGIGNSPFASRSRAMPCRASLGAAPLDARARARNRAPARYPSRCARARAIGSPYRASVASVLPTPRPVWASFASLNRRYASAGAARRASRDSMEYEPFSQGGRGGDTSNAYTSRTP